MVKLDFEKGNGILPAIAQDATSGKVLMLAYMNSHAWKLTLQTGEAHYWSRTRKKIWHKGETSGNFMAIIEIKLDCDGDALLIMVDPAGPACHTGNVSCFYRDLELSDA